MRRPIHGPHPALTNLRADDVAVVVEEENRISLKKLVGLPAGQVLLLNQSLQQRLAIIASGIGLQSSANRFQPLGRDELAGQETLYE